MQDEQNQVSVDVKSWKLLEKTLQANIVEHRRSRRWGIFFKLLTFAYLFLLLAMFLPLAFSGKGLGEAGPFTAVIDVKGMIAEDESASADNIVTALRKAFEDPNTKAVIMRINSPGGSPVQSGYIYDEMRRLRSLYPNTPLYAVIADLGASGAYYIASAADRIYADKSSLVGSVGVTAAGFGFVEGMHKLGIERRPYMSGEHKAFLDPFQEQKPDEVAFWSNVLDTVHRQFIDSVKAGRGDRLKVKEYPEMFSGLIWSGEQALSMGLIDGLGSTSSVARDIVHVEKLQDFTVEASPLERFAKKLGTSVGDRVAMWAGFQGPILR